MKIRNKYKIIAIRSLIIMGFIALGMILTPGIIGLDGMDGGFALKFVGFFVLIMALVTFGVYNKLGNVYKRLADFKGVIAKWEIPQQDYGAFAIYDYKETIGGHRAMRWIITIISLIVGLILIIAGAEADIMITIILCLIVFIWIVSFIAIAAAKRKLNVASGSVIIAREGAIINGNLHNWASIGCLLEGIELGSIETGLSVLEVSYSAPAKSGRNSFTARFPVPRGREAEAMSVSNILKEVMDGQTKV